MGGPGAEIIAIDDTDSVGWVESATTLGEVGFQCPNTFVNNVLGALGSRSMSLLHVQVHGSPEAVWFGTHRVDLTSLESYRSAFARLTPKFTGDAWVDMRACNVGQNLTLLHAFRRLWNVGIVAGRGLQSNVLDANLGFYQIVSKSGTESTSFSVPPWVEYNLTRRAVRGITSRLM
jgi:hypothetical protein